MVTAPTAQVTAHADSKRNLDVVSRLAGSLGPATDRCIQLEWKIRMGSMALDVAGLEAGMLQRADDATSIGTAFEVVRNGAVALFCSDCCGSNGNDCVPEIGPGIN